MMNFDASRFYEKERLDPDNVGVQKQWHAEKLDDSVTPSGTTDTPELIRIK